MINKNKEEIEMIEKEIEKLELPDLEETAKYWRCKKCGNKYQDEGDALEHECSWIWEELIKLKSKLQERIKTSIEWCEDEIEFIENHVHHDDEPCNFDHHGYCQDHHTCGDDKCSNEIILNKLQQLQSHLKWLKQKRGQDD